MSYALYLASLTFRECTRRRVFIVIPIGTVVFLGLYAFGNHQAFDFDVGQTLPGPAGRLVDSTTLIGASLLGLSMFMTMFLASVLAVFLTMSTIRGDAEQGTLQPLLVRPLPRWSVLFGRFIGTVAVSSTYALFLFLSCVLITRIYGGWLPANVVVPALRLALGTAVMAALSTMGSVFLSTLANGVTMFMVYGAGLVGGLLAQIGEGIRSERLHDIGVGVSWALPFEALYQASLNELTAGETGLTRVIVSLGPLGGAEPGGPGLWAWVLGYLVVIGAAATLALARRDL